jgi:hypothetical protein
VLQQSSAHAELVIRLCWEGILVCVSYHLKEKNDGEEVNKYEEEEEEEYACLLNQRM